MNEMYQKGPNSESDDYSEEYMEEEYIDEEDVGSKEEPLTFLKMEDLKVQPKD